MENQFVVSIEKDADGTFVAYNINGDGYVINGRGNTVAEAKKAFEANMREVVELVKDEGEEPAEILKTAPQYKFSVTSLFEYYYMLNASALARYLGLNESLMRQYKAGDTYVSDAQLKRIEDGLHKLGQEFTSLRLV